MFGDWGWIPDRTTRQEVRFRNWLGEAGGGRLVVIVGESPVMEATLVTRVAESEWSTQSLFETDLPRLAV